MRGLDPRWNDEYERQFQEMLGGKTEKQTLEDAGISSSDLEEIIRFLDE